MTVVEQRHGITKGDVREHWKEEVSKAFVFCGVMFLGILMFGTAALIAKNWLLVYVCAVLLLAETAASARMFYAMWRYSKI